jgi:hypothetical protein
MIHGFVYREQVSKIGFFDKRLISCSFELSKTFHHCTVHHWPVMMTTSQMRKHLQKTPISKSGLETFFVKQRQRLERAD